MADMGRALGVVRQVIYDFTMQGCPRNKDGTYCLREFFAWYRGRGTQKKANLETEQIRRTKAQATLFEIKVAKEKKRLVDRLMMLRVIGQHITTASKRLQSVPHLLARLLPANLRKDFLADAESEITDILSELASGKWDEEALADGEVIEDEEDGDGEAEAGAPGKSDTD